MRENEVLLTDDDESMDINHGVEIEVEFWPVEHPLEPQDEDLPIKCPIPTSSLVNDGRIWEKKHGESMRKRAEISTTEKKVRAEAATGAVRKRHHSVANGGDHVLRRMPSLPPLPTHHNLTIFQMLQHFDDFQS